MAWTHNHSNPNHQSRGLAANIVLALVVVVFFGPLLVPFLSSQY